MVSVLVCTLALGACSRNLDSSTYTSGAPVGKVVYGTVISARQVTVKDNDDRQNNALGGIAGGALGGVAGSTVGSGSGRSLATIGGVIAGAMLGSVAEDELSTTTGNEYIVQLDAAKAPANKTLRTQERLDIGRGGSVSSDINQSIQLDETASDAIAVIQQDAVMIAPGTRVAVIYSDDRPRITPLR
jgi:outer membrane lipoprotein SlyB